MTAVAVLSSKPRVVLIDLSSLYRANWHATAAEDVSQAKPRTLEAVKRCVQGDGLVAICCDVGRPFRMDLFDGYKAKRPEKEDLMLVELAEVKARLRSDGYLLWGVDTFEADDVIATACTQARARGHEVLICSADKDLLQLVDDGVRVLRTHVWGYFGIAEVKEKFGVEPSRLLQWLSLRGDASDGIPGARGIGEVKATQLIATYGTLTALWCEFESAAGEARVSTLIGKSAAASLKANIDTVQNAAKLIALRADVPINFDDIYGRTATKPSPKEEGRPMATITTAPRPAPASAPRPAQQAPASRLAHVQKGRLRRPLRYFLYGPDGVGKSTLAADAPNPLFFDIEDGSAQLDVARYPFHDGDDGHIPRSYRDVLMALDDLIAHPCPYRTLVIDTADELESLIWRFMVDRDKGSVRDLTDIEGYGFGKGYMKAVDEWRFLTAKLDRLRTVRGMDIVLLAHSSVRLFKSPDTDDFDRYQPALNDKAAGFLKGWVDVTGFAVYETGAGKAAGDKRARPKGFSTDRRLLKLSRTAAFDAKNRINLPDEIEIGESNPWAPFAAAVVAGYETSGERLRDDIAAECARIGDLELTKKVTAAVAVAVFVGPNGSVDDTATLHHYLTTLKNRPAAGSNQ